jgi:hypothetical protein
MANDVTTVQQRLNVSVDDADKLRGIPVGAVLSAGDGERATKTITAALQREVGIREEN